ncbi:solute carrier family 22 member 4-like [Aplysia californica]|uniref:Solute carrier family 22 member 4-like n=1 Tax=Aplysia californica TaxID=6500 RepID=A0ABM0JVL4_APLCA|nr:solute carrier family 22 member 4-like [Aplysia californica]
MISMQYSRSLRNFAWEQLMRHSSHTAFMSEYKNRMKSIYAYVAELRKSARGCNFEAFEDRMIRDRILVGCKTDHVREKLLEDPKLDLKKAVDIARAYEASQVKLNEMKELAVDRVMSKDRKKLFPEEKKQFSSATLKKNSWKSEQGLYVIKGLRKPLLGRPAIGALKVVEVVNGLSEAKFDPKLKEMSNIVEGIPGVICDIDDVLVGVRDQKEHDERLKLVLDRMNKAGLTLNEKLGLPKFVIETDHKPLLSLMKAKDLDLLTPRIQRFRMRMLRFTYDIEYFAGKDLVTADSLSRSLLKNNKAEEETIEVYLPLAAAVGLWDRKSLARFSVLAVSVSNSKVRFFRRELKGKQVDIFVRISKRYRPSAHSCPKRPSSGVRKMNVEDLVSDLSTCGRFQVLLTAICYLVRISGIWAIMMMAFGSYDPGWTCTAIETIDGGRAENLSSSLWSRPLQSLYEVLGISITGSLSNNASSGALPPGADVRDDSSVTTTNFTHSSCEKYHWCKNIQFNHWEAQTVATEWNLVCDRAWILSLIISIQMSGVAAGSYIGGYIGDKCGRKLSMYGSVALGVVSNTAAYLTTSWETFTVVRFFIGISVGGNLASSTIYPMEFVKPKWRPVVSGLPCWHVGTLMFGVCVMLLRDWRLVHLATAALSLLALLTAVWVPDSVRWLLVHRKMQKAEKVVTQICHFNGMEMSDTKFGVDAMTEGCNHSQEDSAKGSAFFHLFHVSLRKKTLLITLTFFLTSAMFFAIGFGVESLYGDFYLNFILYSLVPIPLSFLVPLLGNTLGRRWALLIFLILVFLGFVSIVVVFFTTSGSVRGITITCLALFTANWLQHILATLTTFSVELFPTVARNLGYGFAMAGARIGSIIAPYVIPRDFESIYVSYLIMSAMALVCCAAVWALPETKGVAMEDVIQDNDKTTSLERKEALINDKTSIDDRRQRIVKSLP